MELTCIVGILLAIALLTAVLYACMVVGGEADRRAGRE